MNVEKRQNNEFAIVLPERFDFGSVDKFRRSYESLADEKPRSVAIDFSNTRYMDSSALGMLINAKGFFDSRNTKIRITHTSSQIKKILSISRFDKKFDID